MQHMSPALRRETAARRISGGVRRTLRITRTAKPRNSAFSWKKTSRGSRLLAGIGRSIREMGAVNHSTIFGLALLVVISTSGGSLGGTHPQVGRGEPRGALLGQTYHAFSSPLPADPQYTITFDEVGLPPTVTWGMSVYETGTSFNEQWDAYSNSTSTTLSNGSYYYTANIYSGGNYTGNDTDGSFAVNGHGLTITMHFFLLVPVEFHETGAPNGTAWAVETGGTPHYSSNTTLSFNVENDSATPFTVDAPPGYVAIPSNGTLNPNGTPIFVNLSFAENTVGPWYPVWFNESGLPANFSWSVTVETQTVSTTNGSAEFLLVNGSNYPYSVSVPTGFATPSSTGVVSVSGSREALLTSFSYIVGTFTFPHWFNSTGLANGATWRVSLVERASGDSPLPTSVSTPSIEFELASGSNGTFEVYPPAGYLVEPRQGSYSVPQIGGGSTTTIGFTSNPNPLTVTGFLATPKSVRLGESFVLTMNVSGVKQGVSFGYQGLPYPCLTMNASSLNCTPGKVGTYLIEAVAADGAGEFAYSNATVVVSNTSGATTSSNALVSQAEWELIGATFLGIGVIAAIAILVIRRRRTS
jgi:hypothetical protein